MDTGNKQQETPQQEGAGRTHGSNHTGHDASPVKASNDISAIDQQEGTMNNGELGGNLGEDIRPAQNGADNRDPDA